MVERLFFAVPQGCLQFVIFPDHTHLLFLRRLNKDIRIIKDEIIEILAEKN